MGFAKRGQNTKGIHIRQYSRAFVFEQDDNRNVFVSADCAMMSQLVKKQVIQNLHDKHKIPEKIYTADNVVLSATHTHSGPGGYLQYVLFQASTQGFVEQTFDAMVNGITKVINGFSNDFTMYIKKYEFCIFKVYHDGSPKHKTCKSYIH